MDYHGIIINVSQTDKNVFDSLKIIGRKRFLLGLVVLYKVTIEPGLLEGWIAKLQVNMRERTFLFPHGFYFHFYRENELIIVFKERCFRVSTDSTSWRDAITYGLERGIPKKQLDFVPCRFEDETY